MVSNYDLVVDDLDLVIEELRPFRDAGGSALVDATTIGIKRDPPALRRAAEETGLHIIMGAGWYRERVYPSYVYELTTNRLADLLIREFTDGVDGTGVRPGIIGEIGTDGTERLHITPAQERVFRAAARAQRELGVAISTHTTHFGALAMEQVDLLLRELVKPDRIIIGHMGERRDIRDVLEVARAGVFVEFDHVGKGPSLGFQFESQRVKNVIAFVRAGHINQLLLSMDICRNSRLRWFGGHGFDYLLTKFVPMLLDAGLTQPEIRTILVENPRRALAF